MLTFLNVVEFFILVALGLVVLGIQVWALIDCVRTSSSDFERVYKRTKGFWLALTGGAVFFGFLYIIGPLMTLSVPSIGMGLILSLAGATAAGVYLADVRPALVEVRGRGRGQQNRGSSW
ncbi:Protein of unknown function [Arthrobacter alpinus]|uniref:DUF2516 domain-containing protein n=1 Tax=Arthrobacter alpinus TaxID=656366 RepID=A0A1H5LTG9_9MICC|nr:DUF2516 family protein [Arthrobacter alpinus]SEE80353.1 Protein of unknown function [Arthrobacter alpinus]